jgi:hypothetical protein
MVTVADAAATPAAIAAAEPVAASSNSSAGAVAFGLSMQSPNLDYGDPIGVTIDVTSTSESTTAPLATPSSAKTAAMEDDVWASGEWDSDDMWDEIAADLCEDSETAAALS